MTEGVMVKLELTIGVTTVVLRIVLVLVVDTITGVCRQEQTREISEAGRDRMLEKMLAWTDGIACLLAKGAVIISRGVAVLVVVLQLFVSSLMGYVLVLCMSLRCNGICDNR
jgi:ABC-type glycerol-3-phosphate transport system permease component